MATAIPMPALSPTMKEGKITRWLKKEGEPVLAGQAIAECETDKSNLEIEAYDDGVLLRIMVPEGQAARVGSPIAYLGRQGETFDPSARGDEPSPRSPVQPTASAPGQVVQLRPAQAAATSAPAPLAAAAPDAAQPGAAGTRVRASPLARRVARERGLDLRELAGSGPNGRVVRRDVEAARSAIVPRPSAARQQGAPPRVPLTTMRRVIAERMSLAKPGVPHFYLSVDVEMDAALALRAEALAAGHKVSVNDIVIKAAAVALSRCPKVNVQFAGDHLVQLTSCDVGVAVALDDGLITPVVRDADQKGLSRIGVEVRELAERARSRALLPEEYAGGSLTVSNLGMYGIGSFVAVINPPQAAILAVGAVTPQPVVRDGQVVVRQLLSVTFSGDHRAIDGAVGAEYVRELKSLLEHPLRQLL